MGEPRSPCVKRDGTPKVRYTRKRDAEGASFRTKGAIVAAYKCPQPPEGCGGYHTGRTASRSALRMVQRENQRRRDRRGT